MPWMQNRRRPCCPSTRPRQLRRSNGLPPGALITHGCHMHLPHCFFHSLGKHGPSVHLPLRRTSPPQPAMTTPGEQRHDKPTQPHSQTMTTSGPKLHDRSHGGRITYQPTPSATWRMGYLHEPAHLYEWPHALKALAVHHVDSRQGGSHHLELRRVRSVRYLLGTRLWMWRYMCAQQPACERVQIYHMHAHVAATEERKRK